jgi:hypothetical protein
MSLLNTTPTNSSGCHAIQPLAVLENDDETPVNICMLPCYTKAQCLPKNQEPR